MKSGKTLVLFDVGGVLLKLDFRKLYEGASALSGCLTPEEFKRRYVESGLDVLACKGMVSRRESVEMLRRLIRPREPATDECIESLVASCWSGPIGEMVELKRRVHEAGFSVGILSNITELALAQISSAYPEIFETFDARAPKLLSCRLGAMKPEPEIYAGVRGHDRVIFIDDKELYVEVPARLRGWRGIWLTPWIDDEESLRAVHDVGGGPRGGAPVRGAAEADGSGSLRRADSVDELMRHLEDFGVPVG